MMATLQRLPDLASADVRAFAAVLACLWMMFDGLCSLRSSYQMRIVTR
jgi:hypothetical protein